VKVKELINLLQDEHHNTEVELVDQYDQSVSYGFSYNSRVAGVSQIPIRLVLLMADTSKPKEST
jgi:hypothetical protein